MAPARNLHVPQVITIVQSTRDGRVPLKKEARKHLGADAPSLTVGDEIVLTAKPGRSARAEVKGGRLQLTDRALAKLQLAAGAAVALIGRDGELVVKRMVTQEREGDRAAVEDVETATTLTRVVTTNPDPEDALPRLAELLRKARLPHSVLGFLGGRSSVEALVARQVLARPDDGDASLAKDLAGRLRGEQLADGSWEGDTVLTARRLRELCELAVPRSAASVRRAADWLLARGQSEHNTGVFFLDDELIRVQAGIVARRRGGERGIYFRKRDRKEMARAAAGDDLFLRACGPRILWPNAQALEALLAAGREKVPRVQGALRYLSHGNWCECGHADGCRGDRLTKPPSAERLETHRREAQNRYRYGGCNGIEEVAKADSVYGHGADLPRVSHRRNRGRDVYGLRLPIDVAPCALVTTRALYRSRHRELRHTLESALWRFAGNQNHPDGRMGRRGNDSYFRDGQQPTALDTFARYDLPLSKTVVLRSMPWILANQNADGSWGSPASVDAATLAVVRALTRVLDLLPKGFVV